MAILNHLHGIGEKGRLKYRELMLPMLMTSKGKRHTKTLKTKKICENVAKRIQITNFNITVESNDTSIVQPTNQLINHPILQPNNSHWLKFLLGPLHFSPGFSLLLFQSVLLPGSVVWRSRCGNGKQFYKQTKKSLYYCLYLSGLYRCELITSSSLLNVQEIMFTCFIY